MQCTSTDPAVTSSVSLGSQSLLNAISTVTDPRQAATVVYSLASMQVLAVAAMLDNQSSVLATAEWDARQREAVLTPLELRTGRMVTGGAHFYQQNLC